MMSIWLPKKIIEAPFFELEDFFDMSKGLKKIVTQVAKLLGNSPKINASMPTSVPQFVLESSQTGSPENENIPAASQSLKLLQ